MSTVLIITCSIGGGHLIATQNVAKKLTQMGHLVIELNIDDFLYPVQHIIAPCWNAGVRQNWRLAHTFIRLLVLYESIYELCLAKWLTQSLTEIITKNNIRLIYDTQPTMTNLLLKIFSHACPQGEYHKVFTDLPYPGNRPYLGSLKRCKHYDNIQFFVHAPQTVPLPYTRDFWKDYAGLSSAQLKQTFALPVHDLYFDASYRDKTIPLTCPLTRYCEHSLRLTDTGYTILPGTQVTTLMLGSQGLNATFDYAKQFLRQAQQSNQAALFFVACAKNIKLYDAIIDYANQHNLPHAQVLPLPQISQDILAAIMWQSDRHIIRPSGLSCLEQLALRQDPMNVNKPLWLHSGMNKIKHQFSIHDDLLKGCFGHERANAQYMLASTPSQMVIPATVNFF